MIMDAVLRKGESLLYEYACAWVSESGAACVLLKTSSIKHSRNTTTSKTPNPQTLTFVVAGCRKGLPELPNHKGLG